MAELFTYKDSMREIYSHEGRFNNGTRFNIGDCSCITRHAHWNSTTLYRLDATCRYCAGTGITPIPWWEGFARWDTINVKIKAS